MTKLFDVSELPEGTSIYFVIPEETNLFHLKEVLNVVSTIKIRTNLCFSVAKNVVPVEDIIEMHNFDDTLTETEMYNARIWFQYTAWALKIGLENLNEVNNDFTWIKCFTLGCRKMAKAGVLIISNGNTVQKWHALFRVEEKYHLLRKYMMKLPYLLVANWYIDKVIHKCGQESIGTIIRHMTHMYIHGTLIPKMLEVIFTGTTKAKLLENYGLMTLFQETVGEWLIKLVFKYNYASNNYYVVIHEKKDTIWCR